MLTDIKLKSLKPREKTYKVTDRDGMYVTVSLVGTISFRYDYRLNGRRETLTIGRYESARESRSAAELAQLDYGVVLSLQDARSLLDRARRSVEQGLSPSRAKVEKRAVANEALSFDGWAQKYFDFKSDPKSGAEQLAESTLAFRRSTYRRILAEKFGKLRLDEVTPQRLVVLCNDLKEKRGPAVAIHAREIVMNVFRFAQRNGVNVNNPADAVQANAIATFKPRERALSPAELRTFFQALEHVSTIATLRLAIKFILLTGVRKGEFIGATWDEIDFETERWTISPQRMKSGKAHVVYLSQQALDLLITFRTCYGVSKYLHPSRYDCDASISNATLNRVIDAAVERIRLDDPSFESFGVHDLRRTFSTSLNRAKFDERWIEMSLAHQPKNRIAAVYNVAKYATERRILMQCWADTLDCWMSGVSAADVIKAAKIKAAEVLDLEIDEDL